VLPAIFAAASTVVAIVAIARVLALRSKLTTLSQSYWELRYDVARLRARVAKLDGGPGEPEQTAAIDPAGVPRA